MKTDIIDFDRLLIENLFQKIVFDNFSDNIKQLNDKLCDCS